MADLKVEWVDLKREPQCVPNPAYPEGIDLDASLGAAMTCSTVLPYPSRRCGLFVVTCDACNLKVVITTAGRPDDPRSVKVACKLPATAPN